MHSQGVEESVLGEGLSVIEAEFYTLQFVVRGEVVSPELRLSDHLNSSTTTLELQPTRVQRSATGLRINLAGSSAYITKAHLLFVLPVREPSPSPDSGNAVRLPTISHTCWAGIGQYSLVGKVHMESGRNPRLFLRSMEERRFLPFTDVRLTFPDGSVRDYPAVIVNRFNLELLAVEMRTS